MARRAMSVAPLWAVTAVLLLIWIFVRPGGSEPTYADILLGVVLVVQVIILIVDHLSPHSSQNDDGIFAQRSSQSRKKNR